MTTFRPDTSFPFLAIARKHNLPYAGVLEFAGQYERGEARKHRGVGPLGDICRIVDAERERRRQVNKDAEMEKRR